MIKFKLNYRTYTIPERFTIEQYVEIQKADPNEYKGWARIMSVAIGIPIHRVLLCDEESLRLGAALILNEINSMVEYKVKDFTKFNFGQFIDLDVYMVGGIDKNLDAILDILCETRPKYIDQAFWALEQYRNFRISTYRSYAGLFGLNDNVEEEDGEENHDPNKVAKGWYQVVVELSNDDPLKMDAVTELPLRHALNFMSLRKEKAETEYNKQIHNDLQRRNR